MSCVPVCNGDCITSLSPLADVPYSCTYCIYSWQVQIDIALLPYGHKWGSVKGKSTICILSCDWCLYIQVTHAFKLAKHYCHFRLSRLKSLLCKLKRFKTLC